MTLKRIHILKTGTFKDMNGHDVSFSESDLAKIADGYNPDHHKAPLVVGHPTHTAPAFGWVSGLTAKGDNLYADVTDINPDFATAVKNKTYPKVSARLYGGNNPNNPTPGQWGLRDVGFLGGHAPAIKGLPEVAFTEGQNGDLLIADEVAFAEYQVTNPNVVARVFQNIRDYFIEKHGREQADKVIDRFDIDMVNRTLHIPDSHTTAHVTGASFSETLAPLDNTETQTDKESDDMDKDTQALEQALNKAKAEKAEIEKKLAAATAANNKMVADASFAETTQTVDKMIADGKILPAEKDGCVAFMESLKTRTANEDGVVEVAFGEGDNKTTVSPIKWFTDFVDGLKNRSPDKGEMSVGGVAFAENSPQAIADKAHKIMKETGVDYATAIAQVETQT